MSRSNPFADIERFFERMSQQFEDRGWWDDHGFSFRGMDSWESAVDLVEKDDEFIVTVDVPGYDENELDIRIVGQTLSIEGRHQEEAETVDERYLMRERTRTSVKRSISLPTTVDTADVQAQLKNGILTVTIPKAEPGEDSHRIEIKAS